jgi:hypothetical protein
VYNGSKHTVVTTGTPEITRLSPRNGFNGFLRALPGDEFLFVTVAERINGLSAPGWADFASASLTPATDARTTRLRRTQRPQPKPSTGHVLPVEDQAEALKRRSSARRLLAHRIDLPCGSVARPTPPRPPHPIPRP